jgi:hypothetical protein
VDGMGLMQALFLHRINIRRCRLVLRQHLPRDFRSRRPAAFRWDGDHSRIRKLDFARRRPEPPWCGHATCSRGLLER